MISRLLFILLLIPSLSWGQVTIEVASTPRYYTPLLDSVFIAGTMNTWNPGDGAFELQPNGNGGYSISISGNPGDLVEYKFARGDWGRVETQANGGFLPNRSFTFANGLVIQDTIANWDDLGGNHTAVGNTFILDVNFPIPQLNRQRRIWIYLPQNYYNSQQSYPVLYMHDGQNLFDEAFTAFGTEWSIDESLDSMQANGAVKAIVVGIDNGGGDRIDEYTPWTHPQYGGGDGELHLDFVISTLKPYIDANFRTLPGRNTTGIMGSSLGGLISMYAAIERPDVFGKAGVFSPSFWYSDSCYKHVAAKGHSQTMRIYMMASDLESATMVPNMFAMQDSLLVHGFSTAELNTQSTADGQHSEWYWAREFPAAYEWLFADLLTSQEPAIEEASAWRLQPLGLENRFQVFGPEGGTAVLEMMSLNGQSLRKELVQKGTKIEFSNLSAGLYLVRFQSNADNSQQKIYLFP